MPYSELVAKKIGESEGRTVWELHEPFLFENGIVRVEIPAGFQCDFCSVPRLPVMWLAVGSIGEEAGLVHDYLYRKGAVPKMSRAKVDELFYVVLLECGIAWWKAFAMLKAVRIGAARNWHKRSVDDSFIQEEYKL